jgi:hypothetical protein
MAGETVVAADVASSAARKKLVDPNEPDLPRPLRAERTVAMSGLCAETRVTIRVGCRGARNTNGGAGDAPSAVASPAWINQVFGTGVGDV